MYFNMIQCPYGGEIKATDKMLIFVVQETFSSTVQIASIQITRK